MDKIERIQLRILLILIVIEGLILPLYVCAVQRFDKPNALKAAQAAAP